jgi:hypothetical protein
MSKNKLNRRFLIGGVVVAGLIIGVLVVIRTKPPLSGVTPTPTPVPPPVNVISIKDRPYASLQPLPGRNELELVIHNLPQKAELVEVTLEYDRNKGVLDAVLKQFPLLTLPLKQTIFLGSKSAGGHITYHEDIIGGTMTLKFTGPSPYTLKVPWHYDDASKSYSEVSTTDGYFQASFDKPVKQTKILVMQSPGAPSGLEGEIIAGPYLVRTVGDLPSVNATVKLRTTGESASAVLWAYDGTQWLKLPSQADGKTLVATSPLYQTYAVIK